MQTPTVFFLDADFACTGIFVSPTILQVVQQRLDAQQINACLLSSWLECNDPATLILCHQGNFPGEAIDTLRRFLFRGGDLIWLGGQPFQREWLWSGDQWLRGDPDDNDYPECPFERHELLGIAPLWVAPKADLDPLEQRVTILPRYTHFFGEQALRCHCERSEAISTIADGIASSPGLVGSPNPLIQVPRNDATADVSNNDAFTFTIAGQTCQLNPFGPGRRVAIGTVTQGGSTYEINDVISLVEPGKPENVGGGRIISCGFEPDEDFDEKVLYHFIKGLLLVLEEDQPNRLRAGMSLEHVTVLQGTPFQGMLSARQDMVLIEPKVHLVDDSSQIVVEAVFENEIFQIPTDSLPNGQYMLRAFDGEEPLRLETIVSVLDIKQESPSSPRAIRSGKYAAFSLHDELHPMQSYCGHASHRTFETIIPGMRQAGIHVYHILEGLSWGWRGSENYDWSRHDRLVERLLQQDPDAYLFPRVGLNPPEWWIQSHPDSLWVHESGLPEFSSHRDPPIFASYYDPIWRQDTIKAMSSLIQHSCESWYGNRIIGFFYQYGGAGEWGEEPKDGLYWVDHHPAFFKWFRAWLKEKYGTDEQLQKAWAQITDVDPEDVHINNSHYFRMTNDQHHLLDHPESVLDMTRKVGPLTLEDAAIPNFFRRRIGKFGILRDPRQVQDVIDFLDCYRTGYTLMQKELSSAFKKAAGDKQILIGTFGGYYFAGPYEIDGGYIHTHYPQFLDLTQDLDILTSASFYSSSENPTGDQVCQCAHESHQLHNKIYLQENDQRTCLTKISSTNFGTPEGSIEETLGSMKRNWMIRTSRGAGLWWFDFAQGFYDHPELLALLRKLQEITASLINEPNPSAFDEEIPRCAMFYSPTSHLYTVIASNYLRRVIENHAQRHFNRYGLPWEIYFPEDLDQVPSRKVYLFLNTFLLTKEQHRTIEQKCKRNGNLLIWLYGSGVLNEEGFDIAKASEITGFELESVREWRNLRIEMTNTLHSIGQALSGQAIPDFGSVVDDPDTSPEMNKMCPQFFVSSRDKQAIPLGTLEGGDQIGFAVKDFSDWKSVYVSSPILPAKVMRALLTWANVETLTDGMDNFYTNGDLVGLNSLKSEYKTIRFPNEFKLRDLMTGDVYESINRAVKVWVRFQDTFLGQVSKR